MSADRRLVIAAGIAGAAALAHRVSAGPLNPPAGPITSTPGPEPRIPISASTTPGDANAYFRITQPGSYFLNGNIRLLANKAAIAIVAEDVTLDLNGFGIIGAGQSGFPLTLILNDGGCTVRNGLIHAWGAYVTLNQARNCVFEDLTIRGPYSGNLEANAQNSIFRRLIVESSGEVGIAASQNCLVEDCVVVGMGTGLAVGIGASLNSIVRNCTVRDVGVGITAFGNCIVENCSVFNATSVSSFDDAAINCDNGSIARNCQVSGGAKAGIRTAGWSHAEGNRVQNSAIGVAITTFTSGPMRCRAIDNHVTGCPIGIKATGTASFIARNTVSNASTSHYDIPAGNALGEVVDLTAGGNVTAATGPWANFRI
jgi:hypothetical protein